MRAHHFQASGDHYRARELCDHSPEHPIHAPHEDPDDFRSGEELIDPPTVGAFREMSGQRDPQNT